MALVTVTLYNGVQLKVDLSFATSTAGVNTVPYNALAADIVWTDVTDRVRGVSIQRGRSNELDTFSTGSAMVELDNRDRRFDPDFGPATATFPGTSGNFLSTPHAAKWAITGNLDISIRCAPVSWASGTEQSLVAKEDSGASLQWRLSISSIGRLRLSYSTNGSTQVNVDSTVATGFSDGASRWVRVTRSSSTGNVIFYTAPDSPIPPVTWTQLGATVASVTTAYYNGTSRIEIGSRFNGNTERFTGVVRRVLVSSTIGGAAIGDFDPSLVTSSTSTTVVAATGETWTRNVSGSPAASWTVGSPYHGALSPMRPIRISAVAPGRGMESMFVGFVDGWPQQYDPPRLATVTLSCSDAFKVLSLIPLGSAWVDTVLADTPRAWLRMNEASQSATISNTAVKYTISDPMAGVASPPFDNNPGYYYTTSYVASSGEQAPSVVLSDTTDFSQRFDGTKWVEALSTGLFTTPVNYRNQYYGVPFTGCELTFAMDILTPWPGSYGLCAFGGPTGYIRLGAYVSVSSGGTATLFVLVMTAGFPTVQVFSSVIGSLVPWVWSALGPKHLMFGQDSGGTARAYLNGVAMTALTTFVSPSGWERWKVGHNYNTGSATYTAASPFKGDIDEVILYDRVPSAARVAAHYDVFKSGAGETTGTRVNRVLSQIGWPTDARDVDTGDSTVQSYIPTGSALSYLQEMERAEVGKLFIDRYGRLSFQSRSDLNLNPSYNTTQVSLTDSQYVDFQPNFTDQLIKNSIEITREGSLPQFRNDSVSEGQYFLRPENITGLLNDEDGTIAYMTEARLSAYAYPRPRVDSVAIMPRGSGLWKEVIEYDIGTRVSTTRSPQGISPAITRTAIIEGIQHEITPSNWMTTWLLSPSEVSDFLVLDNPELDKVGSASARLGY
jgi:hypothetical protein